MKTSARVTLKIKLEIIIKAGLHVQSKHKYKVVYTCDKHKHKVRYSAVQNGGCQGGIQ